MPTARPLLSAAIIVKDEAEFLATCLESIRPVCDEIVVVDTGSSDDSVEVAASFDAVTGFRQWDDDFAAARNVALDLATGRWILYIDADEQLEAGEVTAMRHELESNADAISLRVWFRSRPIWSPYREFRLWQHRSDIRFAGRIHETMVPDIERVANDESLAIRDTDLFRITHYGYEGDQTAKHHRNLPILERRVEEYSDRCYLWNHLGNVHAELGNDEAARSAWATGVGLIRQRGLKDRTDVLCYASYALDQMAQGNDIEDLISEMQRVCPWYLTIDWLAASNHATHGRHRAALPHLERLLAIGIDPIDSVLAYNNAMFTTWAWDLMSECQLQIGDVAGAAATYAIASAQMPDDVGYRTKATALAARSRRPRR